MNNVVLILRTKDDKPVSFEKTGLPGEVKTKILYYRDTREPVEVEVKYSESGVIDMISWCGFNFKRPGYWFMLFSSRGEYQGEYFIPSPNERLIDKTKWGKVITQHDQNEG